MTRGHLREVEAAAPDANPHPVPLDDVDTSVDGQVGLRLPADLTSPKRARAYVREVWPDLHDDVLSDVELIVTELVSNAVKHGAPDIELRLRRQPFAVDVGVLDHGPGMPPAEVGPAELTADSGRGMFLVSNLASRWGVEPLADRVGKTVWASLEV